TRPSATAIRSVAPFSVTSTMRASPRWSIWVSAAGGAALTGTAGVRDLDLERLFVLAFLRAGAAVFFARRTTDFFFFRMGLFRGRVAGFACKQGTGRSRHIRLPHQAFADQKRRNTNAFQASEVCRFVEPALGHNNVSAGTFRRQHLADR